MPHLHRLDQRFRHLGKNRAWQHGADRLFGEPVDDGVGRAIGASKYPPAEPEALGR